MDNFRDFYRKRNRTEDAENWIAHGHELDIHVKLRFFETAADYLDEIRKMAERGH